MARVTVEDCILNVPNRFELVSLAAQRAKQISSGGALTIDRDNDKDAVVSLREIAGLTIDLAVLKEDMVLQKQRYQPADSHAAEDGLREEAPARIAEAGNADVKEAYAEDTAHAPGREAEDEASGDNPLSFTEENVEAED